MPVVLLLSVQWKRPVPRHRLQEKNEDERKKRSKGRHRKKHDETHSMREEEEEEKKKKKKKSSLSSTVPMTVRSDVSPSPPFKELIKEVVPKTTRSNEGATSPTSSLPPIASLSKREQQNLEKKKARHQQHHTRRRREKKTREELRAKRREKRAARQQHMSQMAAQYDLNGRRIVRSPREKENTVHRDKPIVKPRAHPYSGLEIGSREYMRYMRQRRAAREKRAAEKRAAARKTTKRDNLRTNERKGRSKRRPWRDGHSKYGSSTRSKNASSSLPSIRGNNDDLSRSKPMERHKHFSSARENARREAEKRRRRREREGRW